MICVTEELKKELSDILNADTTKLAYIGEGERGT